MTSETVTCKSGRKIWRLALAASALALLVFCMLTGSPFDILTGDGWMGSAGLSGAYAAALVFLNDRPIVHSDRVSLSLAGVALADMRCKALVLSISRKGCSPDDAACEGLFDG